MHYAIFLSGAYQLDQPEFYRALCKKARAEDGKVLATDGALKAMWGLDLVPDLIVGDMDTADEETLDHFKECESLHFAEDKDATDGVLAVMEAFRLGARQLTITGGVDARFETDHLLGNIFMMAQIGRIAYSQDRFCSVKLSDPGQEIFYFETGTHQILGSGGDIVSVIPISAQTKLLFDGLQWPMYGETVEFGDSRTLRNKLESPRATIKMEGRMVVIHHTRSAEPTATAEKTETVSRSSFEGGES